MRRLTTALILSVFCAGMSLAQDTEDFRSILQSYVSDGNKQYERSYRAGIKLYADSLEYALSRLCAAGSLTESDSLEFTADLLKLRADWHYENGNYDKSSYQEAESLFTQALSIYQNNDNVSNELNGLPMLHREMAQLMYRLARYDEALTYTVNALNAYEDECDRGNFDTVLTDSCYITMLDIKSQKAMCLARTGKTDEALVLMEELLNIYPESSDGYYEILRKKGKILMLSQKSGCEREALELYRSYLVWRKADALNTLGTMTSAEREDYWMRIRPFVADCYQLEDADPAFLYDVTLFAKGLLLQLNRISGSGIASEKALASLQHTWTDVQYVLGDDACAVEFVQYEKFDKQFMGAIVLRKMGEPVWVQMMSPDDFYGYKIGSSDITNRERLEAVGNDTERNRRRLYNDETFCSLVWNAGILSAIGSDIKKIYFAPDGYFYQFAFEYMDYCPYKDTEIFRLSSTRRLLESSSVSLQSALFVGDVDFNARIQNEAKGNDELAFEHVVNSHISFPVFENANAECKAMMDARNCPSDILLNGSAATEQTFLELCGKFPMLVISTHGHFDEAHIVEGTDIKPHRSDESLSHSLLAFSGININTGDSGFEKSNRDGILSAREISAADMTNVEIAILSACQTGLGYITADGVFGVQRGFKNAGAEILVVSLWEVNEVATKQLMLGFLKYMQEGLAPHSAFGKARFMMCDNEEAMSERIRIFGSACSMPELLEANEDPYYQNAFIMIDALQ